MPTRPRGRTVTLRDGARVRLRPILPADKEQLAASFERLSAQSRYRRFLTAKSKLSASELAYLVDSVDHSDHEALAAFDPASGALLGIARYVRSTDDPEMAEVAVTVADDWQRRGLGRALLDRLTYRARREGIQRFSALVLGENRPALGLFADLGEAQTHSHSSEVELLIELPAERGMGAQLGRALRAAGAGTIVPARTLAQRVAGGVTPAAQTPLHASRPIRRIVLGLHDGPSGRQALEIATELTARLSGELHIVHAYQSAAERPAAEARLAAAREMTGAGTEPPAARRGEPATVLVKLARELDADLVVIGAGTTRRGTRLLSGSVANRVSHRSPCSVLLVHDEAPRGPSEAEDPAR